MLILKSIIEFFPERFTFGPEFDRIETTASELELKSKMMEKQIIETEAKADAQIVSSFIFN